MSLLRGIPISISISGGGSGPALNEPTSESVAAGGTVAVSGSYSDSFAAGNPGKLWLGITRSSGTLSSTDASGTAVAGSSTLLPNNTTSVGSSSAMLTIVCQQTMGIPLTLHG